MLLFKALISLLVLPRRVILKRGEESGRDETGVGAKGGRCMPGCWEMRSFWFSTGTERAEASSAERSWSVDEAGRDIECAVPWWWTAIVICSASAASSCARTRSSLSAILS
jgi:hypothetical protein